MMDNPVDISSLALELSDLEVAILLCLAAREHCLIETTDDNIHDVAKKLALICSNTYGLSYQILDCSSATSFDDFCTEILAPDTSRSYAPSSRSRITTPSKLSPLPSIPHSRDCTRSPTLRNVTHKVVDIVIAKNFNNVNDTIQLKALELMQSKTLVTHYGVLEAPPNFLFLPLVIRNPAQLKPSLNLHLNDHLIISHFHDSGDDYVYLEDNTDYLSDGQMSASSVVRKSEAQVKKNNVNIDQQLLNQMREHSNSVTVAADIIRYQQDITIFLRLSRAVAGGISARSNMQFSKVSKLLATLHGIDYLTPSIVALAARKVFRHRIIVARPEDDRSLQYGSDLRAVAQVLEHSNPDTILDSVLTLEAPL